MGMEKTKIKTDFPVSCEHQIEKPGRQEEESSENTTETGYSMLEITLLKALYHEMTSDKIADVREYENERGNKFHEIDLEVPGYPEFKTLTVSLEYLVYNATQHSVYRNGNLDKKETLQNPEINAAILCFFQHYKKEFIKKDLPEDLSGKNVLDCLDTAKIPDYRPKYAFPGLILLEDLRNGTAKMPDASKPTFPGLRMMTRNGSEDQRPAYITSDQEYIKLDGKEDLDNQLEELKKKFSIDGFTKE